MSLASYTARIATLSPISFWRCQEASGTLANTGSASDVLNPVNSPTYSAAGPVEGCSAVTLNFNFGRTFNQDAYPTTAFPATLEFWCRPTLAAGARNIFAIRQTTGFNSFGLGLNASNQLAADRSGAGNATWTTALTTDTWVHIAATYRSNFCEVFVDGVSRATNSSSTSIVNTFTRLALAYPPQSNISTGRATLVAHYSSELTAAQILGNYNELFRPTGSGRSRTGRRALLPR